MNKTIQFFLLSSLFISLSFSQGPVWNYTRDFASISNVNAICKDNSGNIWFASKTANSGLMVLKSDGTPLSFSPINSVTIQGTIVGTKTGCQGIQIDPDGNIVAIFNGNDLVRIDAATGVGLTYVQIPSLGTNKDISNFGIDKDGNIYFTHVNQPAPLEIYDKTFKKVKNAADIATDAPTCMAVTVTNHADWMWGTSDGSIMRGVQVYAGGTGGGSGIFHYRAGMNYNSSTKIFTFSSDSNFTLIRKVLTSRTDVESFNWVETSNDCWIGQKGGKVVKLSLGSDLVGNINVKDSIEISDKISTPRGILIVGLIAYIADYDKNKITIFTATPITWNNWAFIKNLTRGVNEINAHGVVVDKNGIIWVACYNAWNETSVPGRTLPSIIRFNTDFTVKDTIWRLKIGSVYDTLGGASRGISLDDDGNILYIGGVTSGNTLYRINATTTEGMSRINPGVGSLTNAAADKYGHIFIRDVYSGTPKGVMIFPKDFNDNSVPSIAVLPEDVNWIIRTLTVTPDGNELILGSTTGQSVAWFHSNNGSGGPYVFKRWIGYYPLGQVVVFDPNGRLWIGTDENTRYDCWDLNTKTMVDGISPASASDKTKGQILQPRGIAFTSDGRNIITADFATAVLQLWQNNSVLTTIPSISLSSSSLSFGNVTLYNTKEQTVNITNTGSANLIISNIALAGNNTESFKIVSGGDPQTISPGNKVTIYIRFLPTSTGTKTATLQITHNASGSPTNISLDGVGTEIKIPFIYLSTNSLSFSDVTVNSSVDQNLIITNQGSSDLIISSTTLKGTDVSMFSIISGGGSQTIIPGNSVTIKIRFSPTLAGSKSASLQIVHNASGSPSSISLGGVGTEINVPKAPELLTPLDNAKEIAINTTLSWSSVTYASTYGLQVSTDYNFSSIVFSQGGLTSTSQNINELQNGITYYWRVNASNTDGTSIWSIIRSFITTYGTPNTPTLVSPVDNATGISINPTLTWNSVAGASSYGLQVSSDYSFSSFIFAQGGLTNTSQAISGLQNGTIYYWRVNSTNPSGTSGWSIIRSFVTIPGIPSAPILLAPADNTNNISTNPTLSWNTVTGASSYGLQVSTTYNFSSFVFSQSGLPIASQTLSGLLNGTTYYWRVNATNSGGTSTWSIIRSFTTIQLPKITLNANSLNFNAYQYSSLPASQNILISNAGGGTLNWSISKDKNWIDISQTSGTNSSTITITINSTNLSTLTNNAVITVTSNGASNNPQTISINYTLIAYPTSISANVSVSFPLYSNTSAYQTTDWKIIGLPGESNLGISQVLSGLSGTDWQAYSINTTGNSYIKYDGSTEFKHTVGKAFWIIKKGDFSFSSSLSTANLNSGIAEIPLHAGFNIIANPFPNSIQWSRIQTYNGNLAEPLWKYDGSFSNPTNFEPYTGYLFKNSTGLTTLKIPYSFTSQLLKEEKKDNAIKWQVFLEFSNGEFNEKVYSFGVSEKSHNELSFQKPMTMGETPGISFYDIERKSVKFATDFRKEFNDFQFWNLEAISSVFSKSIIKFNGIENIPSDLDIYLINSDKAIYQNLRIDSIYMFNSITKINNFSIFVGKSEIVKKKIESIKPPQQFSIGANYPNPFNPLTIVPVSIPVLCKVNINVYDITGRQIRTIYHGILEPGKYFFEWNGRDDLGVNLASSIYIFVLNTDSGVQLSKRLILLK